MAIGNTLKYLKLYLSSVLLSVIGLLICFIAEMLLMYGAGVTNNVVLDIVYWLVVILHLLISFNVIFKRNNFSRIHKLINSCLIAGIYAGVAFYYSIVM